MANPRTCPHCHVPIPTDDIRFDEKLNLICGGCGKVVFPTTSETEQATFLLRQPTWDQRPQPFHQQKYGFDGQEDIPEG